MVINNQDTSFLKDVLVLTVRKSFWASQECEIFPNRVYTRIFFGYSQNLFNSGFLMLKAILKYLVLKPKLIFVGSAVRIVPWLIYLMRKGLLRKVKLIVTDHPNELNAQYLDRNIVFSRDYIKRFNPAIRNKYIYLPLPADGQFDLYKSTQSGNYIFSGGGESSDRDFKSLIDAIRGLDIHLKIVTFSPEKLGPAELLPPNCEVLGRMPTQNFVELMAGSLFVVVPLIKTGNPHGQTTFVQALSLSKAVVVTREVGVGEYVTDGVEGITVAPGDVAGYRAAILRLIQEPDLRQSCERNAQAKAVEFTYAAYSKRIVDLCQELLAS